MKTINPIDILLVENTKEDAELAIHSLKKNNVSNKIFWVETGEKALDFIFGKGEFDDRTVEDHPKIIILDLNLHRVSGTDVLKAIRGNEITKNMSVIVLTASKEEQDILNSYELGINNYIVKPLDFESFSNCLKNLGISWCLYK